MTPMLVGVLDDRSRLVCHAAVVSRRDRRELVHGLSQAFLKRGLPRALMTDNGAAMIAEESRRGLHALGVVHQTTLPYSALPERQAGIVLGPRRGPPDGHARGRAEPHAGSAQRGHPGLGRAGIPPRACTPRSASRRSSAILPVPSVGAPVPRQRGAARAFRIEVTRRQRRSDGTFSLEGCRFEIPGALSPPTTSRALRPLGLQPRRSGRPAHRRHPVPVHPLDKSANADGQRRGARRPSAETSRRCRPRASRPCCANCSPSYAATGLPPAYLPTPEPAAAHQR